MLTLNNKIKNGRTELITDAQMVGNYAYDSSVDKLRRLTSNTNGALNVDVHGGATGSGDLKCRTDIADPSTSTFLNCDSSGFLKVKEQGTANVKLEDLSSQLNSHITDDPSNTIAVGLKGRTTIGTATTETFLKCDTNGVLQVNEDTGYEAQTLGNANNLLVYGGVSDKIDMEGHTHLVIQATSTATAGVSTVQNLQVYYSLDDTNYVLGEVITQNNIPTATTQYAGFIRLERTGFRYVKLFAIGVSQSPTAITVKFSRT